MLVSLPVSGPAGFGNRDGTRDIGLTAFEMDAPVDIVTDDAIDAIVSSDVSSVLARQLLDLDTETSTAVVESVLSAALNECPKKD